MPRSIRIEYPGAFYHVMARGNRREAIFADEDDRRFFLKTLGEACAMTGWRVHGWVLMGNHYHLLNHADYTFGTSHSAEYGFPIQKTKRFHNKILFKFGLEYIP